MYIRGPYIHGTGGLAGRKYVIIYNDDGKRIRQTLYSRWLMEQHLGYELSRSIHVHHVNEDVTDDRVENFELLGHAEHTRRHKTGIPNPTKGIERGWRHGTMYGWMHKKCECTPCSKAKRAWHDKRNAARRITDGARGPYRARGKYEHGTTTMYRNGCRCDECRAKNAANARKVQ